jgi:hypothetical protein
MTRVNVTNTVVTEVAIRGAYAGGGVGLVYANRAVPGAIVAVRGDAVVGGRPVGAMALRLPPGVVERAEVLHAAPLAPERAAVLGGRAPLAAHLPPPAVMNRPMVSKMAPPPAPVPFARQQEALHANPGHPLPASNVRPATAPPRSNSVEATPLNNRQNAAAPAHANPPASAPERSAKKTSKPAKKTTKSEK